jgi:pyruvate/2-oxoglutarate dehydrogenase complex dihydrolipoamide acyltransferase (E2) component
VIGASSSRRHPIDIDDGSEHETGFTMRFAAVILPNLGTGPDVPIVVSHWFAARGERVWEGEPLVEVTAGPATFDVSSPATGRLAEIRGLEDDRVEAGWVLGLVAAADDDAREWQSDCDRLGGLDERCGEDPRPRRPTP